MVELFCNEIRIKQFPLHQALKFLARGAHPGINEPSRAGGRGARLGAGGVAAGGFGRVVVAGR